MIWSQWERLGRVLSPDPSIRWLQSHTGASFAVVSGDGPEIEVYVTGRDKDNRSMIGRVLLALDPRPRVVSIDPEPVLAPGALGTFDENGVSYPCLFTYGDRQYLLYTGWMPSVLTPFQNHLGLAVQTEDGGFERVSRAPILSRTDSDHLSIGSSFVLNENGLLHLWYTSFQSWETDETGRVVHRYLIKYAKALETWAWQRDDDVCIGPASPGETAICRPSVLKVDDLYHMWYCYRGARYRIGYATSGDAVHWIRRDEEIELPTGDSEWDSLEQCYPHVFRHRDDTYMLYAGNDYGNGGIGLARLAR